MKKLKYIIAIIEYITGIIKLRIRQNLCYNAKERCGIAVFGKCSGHYHEGNIPYKGCSICPYFTNVKEGAAE